MKAITVLFLLLSSIGFSQSINKDSIKTDIVDSFFSHLDSIGVEKPVHIPCISEAATNQVVYMHRNKIVGHTQTLDGIGDTIIETFFEEIVKL